MATANEYRTYARECLQWASETDAEDQRIRFLNMARSWTHAALRIDGILVPVQSERPEIAALDGLVSRV